MSKDKIVLTERFKERLRNQENIQLEYYEDHDGGYYSDESGDVCIHLDEEDAQQS